MCIKEPHLKPLNMSAPDGSLRFFNLPTLVNTTSHPWGSMGLLFANSEQSVLFHGFTNLQNREKVLRSQRCRPSWMIYAADALSPAH